MTLKQMHRFIVQSYESKILKNVAFSLAAAMPQWVFKGMSSMYLKSKSRASFPVQYHVFIVTRKYPFQMPSRSPDFYSTLPYVIAVSLIQCMFPVS